MDVYFLMMFFDNSFKKKCVYWGVFMINLRKIMFEIVNNFEDWKKLGI